MIQKLDQQLENFAATQYDSQTMVLIARASIRTRVLARDLLASGVTDPSDVGMTMVFYGTMIYQNLDALDKLFNQLPNMAAIEKDLATPTENQRRTYALLKPALERFSQNPIGKLRLNVLYPGQVRVRVSQAFAPLADALDAARLPLIHNAWQDSGQSILRMEQLDQLADRFKVLQLDKTKLPLEQILLRIKPAIDLQEFRPLVCETYRLMLQVVHILEILQKQKTAFLQARPLIIKQFEAGLANYQHPPNRDTANAQLQQVLVFEDVITRLDQLQDQLLDTLAYEQLLAQAISQSELKHLEPIHQWLWSILDHWYHIRQINRPTEDVYLAIYQTATERWENVRSPLNNLTEQMTTALPRELTPQHLQWLDECKQTRGLFEDLQRLPLLIHQQAQGQFEPLAQVAMELLESSRSPETPAIEETFAQITALSHQWQQAIQLTGYRAVGVLQDHQTAITNRINLDVEQWIASWQKQDRNPTLSSEKLKPALAMMRTATLLQQASEAASEGLFTRMGLIDLDQPTTDQMLGLVPNHLLELARVFEDKSNPQDMKLNQQRTDTDLSFVLALGRIAKLYEKRTPTNLYSPASRVLSRLIWQPGSGEYDPSLAHLCTQMNLMAREWCYQFKQDDPRHRRELLIQLRDIGNKILSRLDELNV